MLSERLKKLSINLLLETRNSVLWMPLRVYKPTGKSIGNGEAVRNTSISSNINEVIRSVLNPLLFFYDTKKHKNASSVFY